MNWLEKGPVKVAILDLYEGKANQGMRCIRTILHDWAGSNDLELQVTEYDVRLRNELPDTSYDIYISSGGPGDPLISRFDDWDIAWGRWLDKMTRWNQNPSTTRKKYIFFICHSFQLACRYFNAGLVCKRKSTAFGVFPIHMLEAGKDEPVFDRLRDPFYAVDSRDYQVIQPNLDLLNDMGAKILCIEKSRPHVPYERAVMGIRFNDYMIGTQFHPEADAPGMSMYLRTEEKQKTVIESHGEDKLRSMLEHLEDPDKIRWTYAHILPNFLNQAIGLMEPELV
ncbi:MAG: GMP synthase [Chitinophagaceae bacterium]|nr:GMP synthase [Chitinophagaceae bacterium]MBP6591125.1 GMP synthase [Chitinophagaceae bacterium]MBP8243637.1 GMP synthase [Chitinophagaceae bacterium]